MSGQAFRGTAQGQDGRFARADKMLMEKLSKEGKFSAALNTKISMPKVNKKWLAKWVDSKVTQLLGREDEIVVSLVLNHINPEDTGIVCVHTAAEAKKIQLEITGFLHADTPAFMEELWTLLASAQSQASGTPSTTNARSVSSSSSSSTSGSQKVAYTVPFAMPALGGKAEAKPLLGSTPASTAAPIPSVPARSATLQVVVEATHAAAPAPAVTQQHAPRTKRSRFSDAVLVEGEVEAEALREKERRVHI